MRVTSLVLLVPTVFIAATALLAQDEPGPPTGPAAGGADPAPLPTNIAPDVAATRSAGVTAVGSAGVAAVGSAGVAAVGSGGVAPVGSGGVAAVDTAAQAKKKSEEERLKKLTLLHYDRRPSAILKAMLPPDPKEEEERKQEEEEAKKKGASATKVASATPTPTPTGTSTVTLGGGASFRGMPQIVIGPNGPEVVISGSPTPTPTAGKPAPGKPGAAPDKKPDPHKQELEALQKNVTLGEWAAVKEYFASLPEEGEHGAKAYLHLLQDLQVDYPRRPPNPKQAGMPLPRRPGSLDEANVLGPEDLIGVAEASPGDLDADRLRVLGQLLRKVLAQGHDLQVLLARWEAGTPSLGGEDLAKRRRVATLLLDGGETDHAEPFLPAGDKAVEAADKESLELLVRYYRAKYASDRKKAEHLESAWRFNLVLLTGEFKVKVRKQALSVAVSLAPKVREQLGQGWLEESFTAEEGRRGHELLTAIGTAVAATRTTHSRNSAQREETLRLQHTVVTALLEKSPERAKEWARALDLMAQGWLYEAEVTLKLDNTKNNSFQRDRYGNVFYWQQPRQMNRNNKQAQPIKSLEILELRPTPLWLAHAEASLLPRFEAVFAKLHLKVEDEEAAFPYIERLATTQPKKAHELAEEFLKVWTQNHDLNSGSSRTNRYAYIWGFEQRAQSIPLTRSKQERNLKELGAWLVRLRALPIEALDEKLLADAFVRSHSGAEVYRLAAIETVFGAVGDLDPATLARLIQTMRTNLRTVWRDPKKQKEKQTKRTDKEIQAEILRGYGVAAQLAADGLQEHPQSWELLLARAAIDFDRNTFRYKDLARSAEFTKGHAAAMAAFVAAAEAYAAKRPELAEEDEANDVYDLWFYASLGACDLNKVSHEHQPDLTQPARIKAAINALKGEATERHMARFANAMFTRLSSVNPAVKYTYLRGGFEIVGDHKDAREARQVFDYYKDLVTEIELDARIDGTDRVGHERPFGLFVNIRHTTEIERESGGFSKYLQNQNQVSWGWNYGRPLEDYRDKFQDRATKALEDHFEVISVTFHEPKVTSRGDAQEGWRQTPYAYVLLKPRGPEVDTIPPLEMDLDFLDTSGYAVLPIASAAIPIDASDPAGDPRPLRDLDVIQMLDERRAGEGVLVLEVKATAHGLIPPQDDLLELRADAFEVVDVEDQGVAATRLDPETDDGAVFSERTWLIKLKGKGDLKALPTNFQFASIKTPDAAVHYMRYVDADLAEVAETIPLEQQYGEESNRPVWVALGSALALLLLVGVVLKLRPVEELEEATYTVPSRLTAFSVLDLLERIQSDAAVAEAQRSDLEAEIAKLQEHFFKNDGNGELDLAGVASRWVSRAQ